MDITSKKGLQLQGNVPATAQQQNQPLLLTPASLQLAHLQAQLTLQRLKLAQGSNPASAAVLSQVLSNVAMFNQLRTSAMVGNSPSAFTSGVLGFPSTNSTLGTLAGGVFNQNSSTLLANHPIRGATAGQQTVEYGKKSGSDYPCDTDRRAQYNLIESTSPSATVVDRQYSVINTQAKILNNPAFQRDVYGQDMQGQQAGFIPNEQSVYNFPVKNDQWKSSVNVSHTGNTDVSNASPLWTTAGQPLRSGPELYNPEEPTSDPKYNSSGMQGFGGYQPLQGSEELKVLQPHQVNDYYAVTPSHLPHQCSICDKKVYNLKDWEQHVKGKLHLQNRTLYTNEDSAVVSSGAAHYAVGRPLDGALNSGSTNSMITAGQDVSSGGSTAYMPAAAMKPYPVSDAGFTSLQLDSKPFPPRKGTVGRVVHICNLPEGSCTENDVINLGLPFGKVTNYILMRSTHQAFLEMAYVEAALAMVQYYQLTPAMINNQKLLIRMSKRYKELQLKKPGKDVETIIQDITSQRERDEMQEHDHYMTERTRSRSPISRSLSPHIHSPGFTSCDTAHSPQGALCRGPERGANGFGTQRSSWDWSSHLRRGEDEREREDTWRSGGSVDEDRPNGWGADRRKPYQKPTDHMNLRSADERGGSRDWHPQRMSYRNTEENYYTKEQVYKSDKPPRPPNQRHDTKSKRRDGGDYHSRSRHLAFDMSVELSRAEDKRQSSPDRGRSKKTTRKYPSADKNRENTSENTDQHSKEKSASPLHSSRPKETTDCKKKECAREVENEEDTDEESWYPKNMEELVTVDEVGGEDDIVEPDLPGLEECICGPKESGEEEVQDFLSLATKVSDVQEAHKGSSPQEQSSADAGNQPETPSTDTLLSEKSSVCPEGQKVDVSPITDLNEFPCEVFKTALEEACNEDNTTKNHITTTDDSKAQEPEIVINGAQYPQDIEALLPSYEQDKAVSEHSIPLGVEFIVPQTGFYCKLCGLFYTSEETAKAAHCRSTVHYRNLQRYLSHLAEESLLGKFSGPAFTQ